jgi:prepilin-type N-terminal cleavage/methylation domain-containing protein
MRVGTVPPLPDASRAARRWHARAGRAQGGFTLVELAIAIAVVAFLLSGLLIPLQTKVEGRQIAVTREELGSIMEALLGFAAAKGYLPCPDTGSNGLENAGSSQCTTITSGIACGRLPHTDLGLAQSDVWGNRYTYCVNELFARRGAGTFTLGTAGNNISICTTQSCATTITTTAVAAVLSHGKNGYGATKLSTGTQNPAAPHIDEQENYDNNDGIIVWRPATAAGTAAGEFDDIVAWLPRSVLLSRAIAAGRLP